MYIKNFLKKYKKKGRERRWLQTASIESKREFRVIR